MRKGLNLHLGFVVHLTFQIYKNDCIKGMMGKTFNNEGQRFNYICAIIDDKLANVREMLKKKKREKEQLNNIIKQDTTEIPKYQKQEKKEDKLKNKFDNMW